MTFISAQLPSASSISPSSSSACPRQTQPVRSEAGSQGDRGSPEVFRGVPSSPLVSPHMLCWLQALAVRAPQRGSNWRPGEEASLEFWGTPSPFQQCCFCLSWLLFPFHQLHPANAKLRGGKGAGAREVLLQTGSSGAKAAAVMWWGLLGLWVWLFQSQSKKRTFSTPCYPKRVFARRRGQAHHPSATASLGSVLGQIPVPTEETAGSKKPLPASLSQHGLRSPKGGISPCLQCCPCHLSSGHYGESTCLSFPLQSPFSKAGCCCDIWAQTPGGCSGDAGHLWNCMG